MFLYTNLQSGRGGGHRDIYIDAMESDSSSNGFYTLVVFVFVIYLILKMREGYLKDKKK